jgi:hypothetical protein
MYKIYDDLTFKPIEKKPFTNADIERRKNDEEIKNKYFELYTPSKHFQKRI